MSSPEFFRALSLVFMRLGGPNGMGADDLAALVLQVPQQDAEARQAASDLQMTQAFDPGAQVVLLARQIDDLQGQVHAIGNLTAEVAALRQRLADIEVTAGYRDPFRVDWERPGKIGLLTPNTIAATAGSVAAPSLYLASDTATGFYRIGANNWGYSVSGIKVFEWASTGMTTAQQITSTVATGTSPLVVASTTLVANLHAAVADSLGAATAYPADATDLPTVITLANALKAANTARGV